METREGGQSVYDRLSDPRSYTGMYAERFISGPGGRGGGKRSGRGKQFVGNTNTNSDEVIRDISQITRPNLNRSPAKARRSAPRARASQPEITVEAAVAGGLPTSLDTNAQLRALFQYFCRFGHTTNSTDTLHNANWAKFCRACPGLVDGRQVSQPDIDLVFSKCKPKTNRRLGYGDFLEALTTLAAKKFPTVDAATGFSMLLARHVFRCPVDPATLAAAGRPRKKKKNRGSGRRPRRAAPPPPAPAVAGAGAPAVVPTPSPAAAMRLGAMPAAAAPAAAPTPAPIPPPLPAPSFGSPTYAGAPSYSTSTPPGAGGLSSLLGTAPAPATVGDDGGAAARGYQYTNYAAAVAAARAAAAAHAAQAAKAVADANRARAAAEGLAPADSSGVVTGAGAGGTGAGPAPPSASAPGPAAGATASPAAAAATTAAAPAAAATAAPSTPGQYDAAAAAAASALYHATYAAHAAQLAMEQAKRQAREHGLVVPDGPLPMYSSPVAPGAGIPLPPGSAGRASGMVPLQAYGTVPMATPPSAAPPRTPATGRSSGRRSGRRRGSSERRSSKRPTLPGEGIRPGSVYERLADPRTFTGVYRRAWESDGRINAHADNGAKTFRGNTNARSGAVIHSISKTLRPNLAASPSRKPAFR